MIVFLKILLGIYGFVFGAWLMANNITAPAALLYFAFATFLLAVYFYPFRGAKSGFFKYSYLRQKVCDFALGCSAVLLFVFGGNDLARRVAAEVANTGEAMEIAIRPSKQGKDWRYVGSGRNTSWLAKTWTKGKQFFHSIFKTKQKSKMEAWQVLLTILSAAAAIFCLVFVAALSCSIACNGNDALALIVFFAGSALVVYLYILLLKAIFKKTGEEKAGIWLGIGTLLLGILLTLLLSG